MKWERAFLIAFLGNYIINNIVVGIASLLPAGASGSTLTPQYIAFVILAAIVVALLTMWYFGRTMGVHMLKVGAMFGVFGFVVWILTTFVSGISGVLAQTGSFSQVISVLPNFWPFIWSWSTLVGLCYWVIPATFIGWWMQMKSQKRMQAHASGPAPMTSHVM